MSLASSSSEEEEDEDEEDEEEEEEDEEDDDELEPMTITSDFLFFLDFFFATSSSSSSSMSDILFSASTVELRGGLVAVPPKGEPRKWLEVLLELRLRGEFLVTLELYGLGVCFLPVLEVGLAWCLNKY